MKKKFDDGLLNGASRLRVEWLELALDDLDSAAEYIAIENPQAAERIAERIWQSGESLSDHPEIGRKGRIEGSREWVISHTPYLIAYRVRNNQIEIMRILHGRQSWPDVFT